jgi:hypothetical protein
MPPRVILFLSYSSSDTLAHAAGEAPQLKIQPNEVLLIAILSNPNVQLRDAFKRWGNITRGVPTQVRLIYHANYILMLTE